MNVRLDVLVSAIARDAGLDPDRVSQDKQNIIGFVNDTRRELYALPQHLQALEFSGEIVGVANVTAGTVSVTNGNSEVTGVGTAFTTAMSGRYISVSGQPWQRVSYVTDTTHLTLESGWNATTTATTTYKIWKRHYALPPKVSRLIRVLDYSQSQRNLSFYDHNEFYRKYGLGDVFTDPVAYTNFSSTDLAEGFLGSFIVTAVATTANSPIVDFPSGTGLMASLFAGDRLKIGNSTTSTAFAVERVLSDTRVALKNYIGTSSSTLTATAMSTDRLIVEFYPALDNTKVYLYEAERQVFDLSNDGDFLERGWYTAVLKGAVAKAFAYVRDPRQGNKEGEYEFETTKLIRNQFKVMNPTNRLKPYIGIRYGRDSITRTDRDDGQ